MLWFTGLSGAGKSTLAEALAARAHGARPQRRSCSTAMSSAPTSPRASAFSKEDRDTNILRIGFVANLLARNGVAVITAAISPYRDIRDANRDAHRRRRLRSSSRSSPPPPSKSARRAT